MGASIQGRGNGGRKRSKLMNEINVTPMVDVMLVLLIIFMITSPMLVAGIEIDLPKTESAPVSGSDTPIVITIDKNEKIFLLDTLISKDSLVEKLEAITKEKKDNRIFIRGDKSLSYGIIMETMSRIQSAGFTKVALISDIKHK